MPAVYQKWLDEDVRWIITSEEKAQFSKLANDEQRDRFVEEFWLRRDPTPDTDENELKEEHYRRIAYSNSHFAARTIGSRSDRGRIYIRYGPPDEIREAPSLHGDDDFPTQVWRYEAFSVNGELTVLEGKKPRTGKVVTLQFVDECRCNEYRLRTPEPE